jgi:hypothetical protein
MGQTYKHFSRNSLLAIYLTLRAARTGATELTLSNDCLKSLFSAQRVHDEYMSRFAESVQPFFPRYSIGRINNAYVLTLYVNKENEENKDRRHEYVRSLPNQDEIDQELGVNVIETYTIEIVKNHKP